MERRAFLKLTLGFALGAGAAAAAIVPAVQAAPLMVPPANPDHAPEAAIATEQDVLDAAPQDAQFIVVRPRRRRRVVVVRPRRRVILVRPRRRRRIYF